jgi:hypothetical protein
MPPSASRKIFGIPFFSESAPPSAIDFSLPLSSYLSLLSSLEHFIY